MQHVAACGLVVPSAVVGYDLSLCGKIDGKGFRDPGWGAWPPTRKGLTPWHPPQAITEPQELDPSKSVVGEEA